MIGKSCSMRERGEYEKIKEEYNNLYGFDIGINEHIVDLGRCDLETNIVKDEIKLKKG